MARYGLPRREIESIGSSNISGYPMSGLPIPHGRQLCLNSFSTFFLNSGLAALPQLYLPTLDLRVAFLLPCKLTTPLDWLNLTSHRI